MGGQPQAVQVGLTHRGTQQPEAESSEALSSSSSLNSKQKHKQNSPAMPVTQYTNMCIGL